MKFATYPARSVDLPCSTNNGEAERECYAHVGPGAGLSAVEHVFPAHVVTVHANKSRHFSILYFIILRLIRICIFYYTNIIA